jgi:hypothetical protein
MRPIGGRRKKTSVAGKWQFLRPRIAFFCDLFNAFIMFVR